MSGVGLRIVPLKRSVVAGMTCLWAGRVRHASFSRIRRGADTRRGPPAEIYSGVNETVGAPTTYQQRKATAIGVTPHGTKHRLQAYLFGLEIILWHLI